MVVSLSGLSDVPRFVQQGRKCHDGDQICLLRWCSGIEISGSWMASKKARVLLPNVLRSRIVYMLAMSPYSRPTLDKINFQSCWKVGSPPMLQGNTWSISEVSTGSTLEGAAKTSSEILKLILSRVVRMLINKNKCMLREPRHIRKVGKS